MYLDPLFAFTVRGSSVYVLQDIPEQTDVCTVKYLYLFVYHFFKPGCLRSRAHTSGASRDNTAEEIYAPTLVRVR